MSSPESVGYSNQIYVVSIKIFYGYPANKYFYQDNQTFLLKHLVRAIRHFFGDEKFVFHGHLSRMHYIQNNLKHYVEILQSI